MLYFVVERRDADAWIEAALPRPFKAESAQNANAHFNKKIPACLRDDYRYRRVEYGEFVNKGGV